ncbi:MAG: hypothetical protein NW201_00425 [Gemmatimonadales bacterium]|nr:hypothetical protein [Gemmatimonadales bacterium]
MTRARRGAVSAELVVLLSLIGLLAGVGLWRVRATQRQELARRIVGDMYNMRLAAYLVKGTQGTGWPRTSAAGERPLEFAGFIPPYVSYKGDAYTLQWEVRGVPAGLVTAAVPPAWPGVTGTVATDTTPPAPPPPGPTALVGIALRTEDQDLGRAVARGLGRHQLVLQTSFDRWVWVLEWDASALEAPAAPAPAPAAPAAK